MPIISYAQQFEDIMLWRALKDVETGSYVDIGANDPLQDSVSMLFYERGWRGIHVEPMPIYAGKLRAMRPDEMVIEAAVGDGADQLTLFQVEGTGLTTAISEYAGRHEEDGHSLIGIRVRCLPLSAIFDSFNRRHIHWMKIDVEGMEESVLRSWGDHSARPWVLVVEATIPNSPEESHAAWEQEVLARGYEFAYFDGLSRFYVHEAHKDRIGAFAKPPNVFDHFLLCETSPFVGLVAQQKAELARTVDESRQLLEAERAAAEEALEAQATELAELSRALEAEREASAAELEARGLQFAELERVLEAERAASREALEARASELAELSRVLEAERDASGSELEARGLQFAELERVLEAERDALRLSLEAHAREIYQLEQVVGEERAALQGALDAKQAELAKLTGQLDAERNSLRSKLEAHACEISELEQVVGAERISWQEAIEANESRILDLSTALEAQHLQSDSRLSQLRDLKRSLQMAMEKGEALANLQADTDRKLIEKEAETAVLFQELDRLKAQNAARLIEYDAEMRRLRDRAELADLLARDLDAIRSSRSWKLTAPVRVLTTRGRWFGKLLLGRMSGRSGRIGGFNTDGAGIEESRVLRHLPDHEVKERVRKKLS